MRNFDFSTWQSVLTTVIGLALFALIGVGIRVLMMLTLQARQQRMNRQINERLKTLIAAYRTLGGSFTGELTVSPVHLRDLAHAEARAETSSDSPASDRPRRIRDAVEAALADILLLGTEEHVRLAGKAAADMAAGRPIQTAELVISLRDFIREALDLDPVPTSLQIPSQGPTRPPAGGARGGKGAERGAGGGGAGGGGSGGGGTGGGGMGVGGMAGGIGHSDPVDPLIAPGTSPSP